MSRSGKKFRSAIDCRVNSIGRGEIKIGNFSAECNNSWLFKQNRFSHLDYKSAITIQGDTGDINAADSETLTSWASRWEKINRTSEFYHQHPKSMTPD